MKRIIPHPSLRASLITALLMPAVAGMAHGMPAPACDEPGVITPDSTGFNFTDKKIVKHTSVKDQNKSGTCWSFSGTGVLEDEVLRHGGPELDLSDMWAVRNCYIDKAKKYIRSGGTVNFSQGGSFADVLYNLENYGAIPEEAYTGLNYGEAKHAHFEMADALTGYLEGILKNSNKHLSTAWLPGFIGILDAYLGPAPESFTYNGKTYTPQSFAKEMGLNADDFINITSYTHHPFYKPCSLELADNWLWSSCQNVPMDELKAVVDNALEKGYTVGWAADVSEGGFKWPKGYAVLPAEKTAADMEGTELSRWVKLSDKERDEAQFDIKGPVKEKTVTQESRQKAFDNLETTDDHGMVIVGYATDQEGNRYYKVKNSWDTNQIYDGYFYVSEPYFLEKTISVMVNKGAVPSSISKKFKG